MLTEKRSADVTSEVNLREHLHLCQMQVRLHPLALKLRGYVTRSPKQGYQWNQKKRMSTLFKKKVGISINQLIFILRHNKVDQNIIITFTFICSQK